jgi:hypothetical protein
MAKKDLPEISKKQREAWVGLLLTAGKLIQKVYDEDTDDIPPRVLVEVEALELWAQRVKDEAK